MLGRWREIVPHLDEFQSYLATQVPRLSIEPLNDREWTYARYRQACADGVFDRPGVYFIFAPDQTLEYIGVATGIFHDRIWSHDEWVNRRWTDGIALNDDYRFLAPSLELFLISRLVTRCNHCFTRFREDSHE
mgnify:CR=1 FL=1